MSPQLLLLFPALPLLAAGLSVVVRSRRLDRVLLLLIPLLVAVGGAVLVHQHLDERVISHRVGGFIPGVSIPFVSDMLSAVMLLVTAVATLACTAFLIGTREDEYRFLPALVLMLIAGVNGALLTGDLFNLFVFVEVMLLPSYALLAVTGTWMRLGAARSFVLVNLLTSTTLLVGVGYVYAVAGTVNLAELAGKATSDPRLGLALCIVLLALAVKASVVPVHGWLPQTYTATSAGVMALFAGVHTKVALYAIYRVVTVLYDGGRPPWQPVLVVLVVATMIVGALGTFGMTRVRRALAFQMIAGIGHVLVGVAIGTAAALGAGLFYMAHHIITMGALLLLAGAIEHTYGTGRFDRLADLVRREKAVAAAFALGLMSLVGLPPLSGLWGKVALVGAAADGTTTGWVLVVTIVVVAALSLLALQRLWEEVFWGPPMETYRPDDARTGRGRKIPLPDDVRIPTRLVVPGTALIVVSMLMFFLAGPLMTLTSDAGQSLHDVATYVRVVSR